MFQLEIILLTLIIYVCSILIIYGIVILDKNKDFLLDLAIDGDELIQEKSEKNIIATKLIDLRGQEEYEELEIIEEKPQKNKKIMIQEKTKIELEVSKMDIKRVRKQLSTFGVNIIGGDDEARSRYCDFLEGMEINNLRRMYASGEHELLEIYAKARILMNPEESTSRVILIRSLFKKREFEKCMHECRMLIRKEKRNIDAHRFIARCHKEMGEIDKSIKVYEKISSFSWKDIDSRYSLMKFYWNMRRYDIAKKYNDQILDLAPDDIRYRIYAGRIRNRLNNHVEALNHWNLLLELDPDNIDALVGIGMSMLEMGSSEEGIKYLKMACENDPTNSRSNRSLIQGFIRVGDLSNALEVAKSECMNKPEDIKIWQRRFVLSLKMNNSINAKEIIDEILDLNDYSSESIMMAILLCTEFLFKNEENTLIEMALNNFYNDKEVYVLLSETFDKTEYIGKTWYYLRKAFEGNKNKYHNEPVMKNIQRFLQSHAKDEEYLIEMKEEVLYLTKTTIVIDSIIDKYKGNRNKDWEIGNKVAMVSSSLGRGGAERQVVACLEGLESSNEWSEVVLFCNKIDRVGAMTFEQEVRDIGVTIDEFGGDTTVLEGIRDEELNLLLNQLPAGMARGIKNLVKRFRNYKPKMVHSWQDAMNISVSLAALIAGVPNGVLFARSMRPDQKTTLHLYKKEYIKEAYKSLDRISRFLLVHNSKAGLKSYSEWLGIDELRFEVLYNGIDIYKKTMYDPEEIKEVLQEMNVPQNAKIVGSVFRMVDEKRPVLWLNSAISVIKERRDIHFIIVGGGEMFDIIKQKINDSGFGKNIHLAGQSNFVSSWLSEFDLFLLTSRIEGLPNVLIEAQVMGVPVISTNAGGAREVFIDGKTGVLCKNDEPNDIKEDIISSLDNQEWLLEARKNSKRNIRESFSQEVMVRNLLKIYKKAQTIVWNES